MKEIQQLQNIVKSLNKQYAEKYQTTFTLDGKLVGDIGEVLAAKAFGLILFKSNKHRYDGCVLEDDNKKVQIKSTIKGHIYFPRDRDKTPDYFLAILINNDGTFEVLYNGTGVFIWENYILKRKMNLNAKHPFSLSLNILRELNKDKRNKNKLKRLYD